MNDATIPETQKLSRRSFLTLTCAAVGLLADGRIREAQGGGLHDTPLDVNHSPVLELPHVTMNGAKVPIVVKMSHPMEPEHYIKSVHVVNKGDPVPSKGVFHFSPANGKIYLAFQARMHDGFAKVSLTAECSRHGQLSSTRSIYIPEGNGGCCNAAPLPPDHRSAEIAPPTIRIPELVKRGRIERDEIIHVQLKIKHPNRTGLVLRNGKFFPEFEPFYLASLVVFYETERVSWFEMTSALSDDPFITFPLMVRTDGLLRVILTNNRGQQFEAKREVRVS